MTIKQELPQFEGKPALLVVTGMQSAKIYLALNKEIMVLEEMSLPNPESEYSDREGHFKQRGNQAFIASGSVYEPKKGYLLNKFLSKLREMVIAQDIKHAPDEIYLFTPDYMKNDVRKSLTNPLADKVVMELEGNFVDSHEFDLLKLIQDKKEREEPRSLVSREVKKLLKKKKILRSAAS
ncbi:hypothetical protein CVU83_02910 [Candidatus Falkowbacteria bacterium HGW-Falkowbacteria-2]|uniref:Uncharacterized protein n=1 Tax=Candidatus Falkowbacteria bacterium HGW-Falkowbacteria-2 TaxID=2013769 RepID=A0A2N2DYI5_9BACT|nr:MAG: hypothetical protein CVU83_02910 [Candidatus Falkowbacteria bacterium HGW-Falkowbacteria-2]